ncbi:MAG: hypothetical protein JXQ29_02350 [Planctomycetes bacterium]|nr:hypothetical protein [Planctomycetota bacterium]
MNSANHRARGTTVTELIVSFAILSLIFLCVFAILSSSSSLHGASSRMAVIEDQSRTALDTMAREIRLADRQSLLITTENGADRLDCRVPLRFAGGAVVWSSPITFRYEPSSFDTNRNGIVDEGRIVRLQNGARRILCQHVQPGGLGFEREQNNVAIRMRLFTAGVDRNDLLVTAVETSVSLRNSGGTGTGNLGGTGAPAE